jgi:hypothetical protein
MKIKWTGADHKRARKQGWGLFTVDRRNLNIQVYTEHPVQFAAGDDDAAVVWVIGQALKGDKTCVKGLLLWGLQDPCEFGAALTHAVLRRQIVPVGRIYSTICERA